MLIKVIILMLLLFINSAFAASESFDIITMNNGNYHHGTVAHESFNIQTSFGIVTIPYSYMAELHLGKDKKSDKIKTRLGDIFTGTLLDKEFLIIRDQQPTLPLTMMDTSEIIFSAKRIRYKTAIAPDAVETRSGDLFFARIKREVLTIKTRSAIEQIAPSTIYLIDFAYLDYDEDTITQITLNGNEQYSGRLNNPQFHIQTRYGQTFIIPAEDLDTLAYSVNFNHAEPDFNYRKKLNPAAVIQDQIIGGQKAPEMVALRGGYFQRGDLQGDGDVDEKPVENIYIKPFAIGIYEITFDEYDDFCADTGCSKPDDQDWGRGRRPVVNVSWNEAQEYIKWLSSKTRQNYRLPTDAEWEYAARALTKTRYWWGQEVDKNKANCEGCGSLWDGEKTSIVGKFIPNHFGLHDTAGNVFEWVEDCFNKNFTKASADKRLVCGKRIIRGGAWSFTPKEVRSANRWRDFPTRRSDDTGFRVAREL